MFSNIETLRWFILINIFELSKHLNFIVVMVDFVMTIFDKYLYKIYIDVLCVKV